MGLTGGQRILGQAETYLEPEDVNSLWVMMQESTWPCRDMLGSLNFSYGYLESFATWLG